MFQVERQSQVVGRVPSPGAVLSRITHHASRILCLLVFIGVHSWFTASAFSQTNIYATLTVTNVIGITNGNSFTVAGSPFIVTNSTSSLRYIAPTNTAGGAATNIFNKLAAALTNNYFVNYGSPTSIVVRPFTGGSVSLTASTNWAIVRFTTNTSIAGGIKASNVIGSSFTLLGSSPETITNWSQIGGGGGGGDISTASSNNMVAAWTASDASSSNALAAASGIVNATTPISAINTNLLKFYGGNTSLVDNVTLTYNAVFDGYSNTPAANKRLGFISPVNGHGVFTNNNGFMASNTVVGYTGFQTWSNISFPSNVNFSAEFVMSVATSNTAAMLQSSTMNYGQFGWGFWEPTTFGNPLSTPGLFPVKVSADGLYWKIGTAPSKILGLTGGAARDPALLPRVNGWDVLTYTTNSIATVVTNIVGSVTNVYPAQTNSSAITLLISSNMLDWRFLTNLTFFKTNESIPSTNASHWEGKACVVGPQVWLVTATCTNASKDNFELRIRTTSTNDFPYNWSEPIVLNQNTYSNLIDGTPYFTGTNVIMAAKDNSTTFAVIGTFASTNPASTFTWTINNPGSPVWGGGWEGLNWHTFYGTNGLKTYGLSQRFYQGPSRGNGGDSFVTGLAISTNPAANGFWSGMTNIYVPRGPQGEYLQNFQLRDLNTAEERDQAEAIINQQSGNYGMLGIFPAKPSTTQFTLFGWPYVEAAANPIPGNFAGVWLAPGSGVGFYGLSDGTNYLSASAYNRAQTNAARMPNSIDVLAYTSNSIMPLVPVRLLSSLTVASNTVAGYTQPTTNGLSSQGGVTGCNGTNWWTVLRDSAGVLTTNKVTLTPWP